MREIIGVTGKSGTGKSTVAKMIEQKYKNCTRVDVDELGHNALMQPEVIEGLKEKFGNGILDDSGNIDRKKMGELIFAERHNMKTLSDLTWKHMQQELDRIIASSSGTFILEWILLPHSKYWDMCNTKVLVSTEEQKRRSKVMKRDNISEEYLNKRDNASIDYSPYEFDYIIEHDYQDGELKTAVNNIYRDLNRKEGR